MVKAIQHIFMIVTKISIIIQKFKKEIIKCCNQIHVKQHYVAWPKEQSTSTIISYHAMRAVVVQTSKHQLPITSPPDMWHSFYLFSPFVMTNTTDSKTIFKGSLLHHFSSLFYFSPIDSIPNTDGC